MPIVFVHGVNNRKGPGYRAEVLTKQSFLKKHLAGASIEGKTLGDTKEVWFPYWGDLGATFAWQMASLPHGQMESLGSPVAPSIEPLVAHVRENGPERPNGGRPRPVRRSLGVRRRVPGAPRPRSLDRAVSL
jgi:hypothetical protein